MEKNEFSKFSWEIDTNRFDNKELINKFDTNNQMKSIELNNKIKMFNALVSEMLDKLQIETKKLKENIKENKEIKNRIENISNEYLSLLDKIKK